VWRVVQNDEKSDTPCGAIFELHKKVAVVSFFDPIKSN
jgi:hypothetical protein